MRRNAAALGTERERSLEWERDERREGEREARRNERKRDGTGAASGEGREGNERRRLWASRAKRGADGEPTKERYTSGVAGWEAEKGSLIASECKRFGVRWDTGRQSGGRAG